MRSVIHSQWRENGGRDMTGLRIFIDCSTSKRVLNLLETR